MGGVTSRLSRKSSRSSSVHTEKPWHVVKVDILYWEEYRRLKAALELHVGAEHLKTTGKATKMKTGWFEVTIDDKLVHSKKNGDGHVDSPEKLQKITAAIKSAVEDAEHHMDNLEH